MSASRSPACVRVSSWFWSSCGTTDVTGYFWVENTNADIVTGCFRTKEAGRPKKKKKNKTQSEQISCTLRKTGGDLGKIWQKILDQFSHWPKESVEILYIKWWAICWMGITIKIFGFNVVFCYTDALQCQISQVSKVAFFLQALPVIERRSTKNKSPSPPSSS